MVRNLWQGDLALLELAAAGKTDAPREVIKKLESLGHVERSGGLKLTATGRDRAVRLKPAEHDLRRQFTAQGGGALRTVGGSSIRVGGGCPDIRA